jgi:hypothetical protein
MGSELLSEFFVRLIWAKFVVTGKECYKGAAHAGKRQAHGVRQLIFSYSFIFRRLHEGNLLSVDRSRGKCSDSRAVAGQQPDGRPIN